MTVCAIVLAAGAGTRFGGPKALARDAAGEPWLARAVRTLRSAGCDPVLVVLGAAADDAAVHVPREAVVVRAPRWREGLSASVRASLDAAAGTAAVAALLVPVDVPELPASACRRVMRDAGPSSLRRARYAGAPGHPVLIGRDHWGPLGASLRADRGAGGYLRAHGAEAVECADLWHGRDVDRRPTEA
ncbi:nucleotidyltransferase family protein [Microbacterium hominis]|uniref:nucleotidyltransferase family protein n=1 Tax=Microbacterium hominis TaxID=162426 RepID=UPI001966636A|nr:nucleotidyltransferase family protein [Microbacterium hominis]QRY39747.1 nucleotidyltransferase family protein [Microbacterium hominis]